MKIQIHVTHSANQDDKYGHADVAVYDEGEQAIAEGYVGGEPEDNNIIRDYKWIVPMLEALAKRCGAEVEIIEFGK